MIKKIQRLRAHDVSSIIRCLQFVNLRTLAESNIARNWSRCGFSSVSVGADLFVDFPFADGYVELTILNVAAY